jgi:hypothetical protein
MPFATNALLGYRGSGKDLANSSTDIEHDLTFIYHSLIFFVSVGARLCI